VRGERMKSSLEPALAAASSAPEKLAFDGGKDLEGATSALGIKLGNVKDGSVSARRRGASVQGSGAVTEKAPSPSPPQCRAKKTTLPPTAQGSTRAHRRSPSLHVENAAEGSNLDAAARTLRQSASFSGGIASTPRPDARASPTPRASASKPARHGPSVSRRLEDDATFSQDHNVQVGTDLTLLLPLLPFVWRLKLLAHFRSGFHSSSSGERRRDCAAREVREVCPAGECADDLVAGATGDAVHLRPCGGGIRHPGANTLRCS
jgi:hypothetical protein